MPEHMPAPRGPSRVVLIAGGGIGGLAAALSLARAGIASEIIEKRAGASEEGAGIQIGPNGTRIIEDLGVAANLEPDVARPEAIRVRDGVTARDLARLPLGGWIAARHGAPYWTAHRADLHRALLERVKREPLVAYHPAASADEVEQRDDRVTVSSRDGRRWAGDALLAADGLWSGLRPLVQRGVTLTPARKCALRAVIARADLPPGFDEQVTGIWLSPLGHVVHYPVRGGREVALVLILRTDTVGEGWGSPVLPGWVEHRTGGFAPELRTLFARVAHWRLWSLMTAPAPRRLAVGRVALLGDAAHPVLPFLAQGAVMALEDGAVLARRLARSPLDVAGALAGFERDRLARVARVAAASARNGRIYHLSGPMAAARNLAMAAARPERLMASYDWLYGWRAA